MRVRGGEMVEEVLAPGQPIVADPEVLEQSFRRKLDHAVRCARRVADSERAVDPARALALRAGFRAGPAQEIDLAQQTWRIGAALSLRCMFFGLKTQVQETPVDAPYRDSGKRTELWS